jgi:ferredoxin
VANLRYLWINVVQRLLRVLPFPCRTGLIEIGRPNRSSPVLLTGNFQLTVERVKRCKSGHKDRLLRTACDAERCKGAAFCEQVCPVDVFVVDHARHLAALPRATQCVQ